MAEDLIKKKKSVVKSDRFSNWKQPKCPSASEWLNCVTSRLWNSTWP